VPAASNLLASLHIDAASGTLLAPPWHRHHHHDLSVCGVCMQVRVARLELPQPGLGVLSRFVCRNVDYNRITVHFKLVPHELRPLVDVPYRLRKDGNVLPGSPVFQLQPDHCSHEVVLEVVQGNQVLAR